MQVLIQPHVNNGKIAPIYNSSNVRNNSMYTLSTILFIKLRKLSSSTFTVNESAELTHNFHYRRTEMGS